MEKIVMHSVQPEVFSQREEMDSEVWMQHIEFNKGHLYLLEADSGNGKSTFCSYIVGYRHDYTGEIDFDEKSCHDFSIKQWVDVRRYHVSHLFQELRLFPELTAYENVDIKNRMTGFKTKPDIVNWFDRLGIADKMSTKIRFMSFGQQQRVAMIRALVQPFDFLLADEPISHLDDTNANVMGHVMMEEAKRQGAGVIVSSIGKHMNLGYERTIRL